MRTAMLFAVVSLSFTPLAIAQESLTPHTLKGSAGGPQGSATLADVAWLAGSWVGDGLGGVCEEQWSAPGGGAMIGTFRLIKDGKAVFYEFLTITESNGSLVLRLKHFNPDLTGWEERDKSVAFPFVAKRDGGLYFNGLTFLPERDGTMTIHLAMRDKEGQLREETFRMRRP